MPLPRSARRTDAPAGTAYSTATSRAAPTWRTCPNRTDGAWKFERSIRVGVDVAPGAAVTVQVPAGGLMSSTLVVPSDAFSARR